MTEEEIERALADEVLDDAPARNPIDRLLAEHDALPWVDGGSGPGWLVCQHLKPASQCESCTTPDS